MCIACGWVCVLLLP